ncbi:MAG TPA: hypothetical protein VFH78_14520 [Candidatus Thermoplasmatota archaeon]|nr:hypothetical protein [Candidatus Thermoplasmatota archaeon]
MTTGDPLTRSVDAVAGRTGLTRDAVAILFIVAGVLVLFFEWLVRVVLGITLIVIGVVWLVTMWRERQAARPPV